MAYRYDIDLPSVDKNVRKQRMTFTGSKEEIDNLKNKRAIEITCTQNIGKGWLVTYNGSSTGVLDIKAQYFVGNVTYLVEKVVPNAVKKFTVVDTEEYSPYEPMGFSDTAQFVELDDHLDRTSKSFTKEYHERKYSKSSILSVYEFLQDKLFEDMIRSIKVEDE